MWEGIGKGYGGKWRMGNEGRDKGSEILFKTFWVMTHR